MSDRLQDTLTALKIADAAGNTVDAAKLAKIADRLRYEKPSQEGFMSQVNKAIGEAVTFIPEGLAQGATLIPGVPKEVGTLPRKYIEKGFKAIGAPMATKEPETISQYAGRGLGEVASMLIPGGIGSKILTKGTGLASRIARDVMQSIARAPKTTLAAEALGGLSAGAGRGIAATKTKDPTVGTFAEMGGGVAGSVLPTAAVHSTGGTLYRAGKISLKKLSLPFTKKGAEYRAGRFLTGLVDSPEKTIGRLQMPIISDLPPAVKAGENRLTRLHKALIQADPAKDAAMVNKLSASIAKLEGEMRKMGYGSPELLADVMKRRTTAIEASIDNRILKSMQKAQDKLAVLPVSQRQSSEAIVVRNELESAMRVDRQALNELWQDVPKSMLVEAENSNQVVKTLKNEISQAQQVDIPAEIKSSFIFKKTKRPITINELQGLRSKLLETARISRKDGKWNKARIAEDVADALLEDMGIVAREAQTPEAEILQQALTATYKFKDKYEKGIVGRILGYAKTGAPAISPTETLDISVGRMGIKGAVDVSKVAPTPEAMAATEKYLARSFTDYATDPSGAIIPTKANKWVRNNEDLMDLFPKLKNQITDTSQTQAFAIKTRLAMEARKKRLLNPEISVTAKFLKTDPAERIDKIFKSANSQQMMSEAIRQTRKDSTGNALEGMRAGVIDYLMEKSEGGTYNALGEKVISGNKLMSMIMKNEKTLTSVLSPEQTGRLKRIAGEFQKIESYEKTRGGKPEIKLDDFASGALRIFARILGAKAGGRHGKESMGGSLQLAGIYSGKAKDFMTKLTRDRAEQLVKDAILADDPGLLKSLLLATKPGGPSWDDVFISNRRMNVWLAGSGSRVWQDIKQEE